tara:strand:+ start:207 stop:1388 length:1182 start_codon:yes stop_codon:yes gene_type:complete
MRYLILFLSVFFTFDSFCTTDYISEIRIISKNYVSLWKDGHSQTVHSACRLAKYVKDDLQADYLRFPVANSFYQNNRSHIDLILKHDSSGNPIKAPLLVLVSGIFGEPFGGIASHLVKRFSDQGFHVLSLGNPLGKSNLVDKPRYPLAHFIKEARAYYEKIKAARINLQRLGLIEGKASIYGISYGAFTSAVVKKIDRNEHIKKLILISPPKNFGLAITNMDNLVKESKKYKNYPDWMFPLMSIPFCLNPPKKLTHKKAQRAKAIFTFSGFQRGLADQISYADKLFHWGFVPRHSKDAYNQWRKNLTFNYYFENFFPSLKRLYYSPLANLFYWISLNDENVIILSSYDDVLNNGVSWPKHERIFLIKTGGHYGFANSEFYERFLSLAGNWLKI